MAAEEQMQGLRQVARPVPGYCALREQGRLARRATKVRRRMAACDLCSRGCGIDRAERQGDDRMDGPGRLF
jgi:uncharacterized Fe-S radical SAM superfamily protein PflX